MSRLTKRLGDQVILKEVGITDCGKICDRRKDFDNPCDECPIDDAFRKLAHYEALEEQGRLITLPCKVGDTVYAIRHYGKNYKIEESVVNAICIVDGCIYTKDYDREKSYNIRELIATKEEAEARLEELKNEQERRI